MSNQHPDSDEAGHSACDEVVAAYLEGGARLNRDALLAQHPEIADELREFFRHHDQMSELSSWWREAVGEEPNNDQRGSEFAQRDSQSASSLALPTLPGYEIVSEIARGGMGVVYQARQISLNRPVAVKMILHGQLASEADRRRFANEAAAAAQLRHPHIVIIHETGEYAGQPFFSMEFVAGESLASIIHRGPLAAKQAASYVQQVALATQFAHSCGVLHRDIKPSNVLIDEAGLARVTDFGLAKHFEAVDKLTITGQLVGTPAYMAPEQIVGPAESVGPASDVYALGALLYELITGSPPYRGATSMETLMQVLESDPQLPRRLNPGVPRELEMIALKCLEKNPRDRYASAQAVADDLARHLDGDSISISGPKLFDRVVRTLERSQYDREFHAWSRMLFCIAVIALITHGLVFVNHALDWSRSFGAQFAIRTGEALAMAAVLAGLSRDWYPPRGAPARQLWAVWLGYMAGSFVLVTVTYLMTPSGKEFNELAVYPPMAVLAGLAFIVLGSSYWGYCYAIGAMFLVLALGMPAALMLAPLVFGLAWAASLSTLAAHLSRLSQPR
jgi:serine/threonine protein kinase